MIKIKTKSIIKKIALALAGIAALTGIGFGVKAIVDYTKNDLKTISLSFEVGNLGADGKFVEDEATLYTKDAFACDGLQIKPDFDSTVSYQLFFYDDLDNFMESTDILTEAYAGGVHDGYARMVVIPTNDEDDKISWTEKMSYPKQLSVKVSKTQTTKYFDVLGTRLKTEMNISALQFARGTLGYDVNGNFIILNNANSDKNHCCTTKQLLTVKGGSTLTFGSSSSELLSYYVLELEVTDSGFNFTSSDPGESNSLKLRKNTNYIFIVCNTTDNSDISDSTISSMNTRFQIS